ncbi:hypothetical protein F4774DRAFT_418343 [Daldinia eschscholtzii]|nr:hypothetical protein F4774DRAFT_418343 [Daldinia eschscholtzii]
MDSSALLEKLRDLRDKYPGDELTQNYALTTQIPQRIRMDRRRMKPGFNRDIEEFALDAAIVVARHLLAAVADQHRQIKNDSPLARMLWADLSDPEGYEGQEKARMTILKSFRENPNVASISFYAVMESDEMLEILWDLPAFQLWHPTVMAKKEGSQNWDKANIKNPAVLKKKALIVYDGSGDLGEHISKSFGVFLSGGVVQHWTSNEPVGIRVFHTNTARTAEPKKWRDLREIWVKSHGVKEVQDENGCVTRRYDETGGPPKRYILLATVYLGAWKGETDRIRLYGADGGYVMLPRDALPYAGIEWSLGSSGDKYLLYYRLATLAPPAGGPGLEFVVHPKSVPSNLGVGSNILPTAGLDSLAVPELCTTNVGLPLALRTTAPSTLAQPTAPGSEYGKDQ